MRRYSSEWVKAVSAEVASIDADNGVSAVFALVIGTEQAPLYTLQIQVVRGSCSVVETTTERADATFITDMNTAVAVANGVESARDAFLDGRMVLRGDADVLVEHAGLIGLIGSAITSVAVDQ